MATNKYSDLLEGLNTNRPQGSGGRYDDLYLDLLSEEERKRREYRFQYANPTNVGPAFEPTGLTDIAGQSLGSAIEAAPSGIAAAAQAGRAGMLQQNEQAGWGEALLDFSRMNPQTLADKLSSAVFPEQYAEAQADLSKRSSENLQETLAIRLRNAEEAQRLRQQYLAEGGSGAAADIAGAVGGSATSIAPMAGALAVGAVSRNPLAALATQRGLAVLPAAQAYADAYAEFKGQYPEAPDNEAHRYAASMAGVEYGIEAFVPAGGNLAGTGIRQVAGTIARRTATEAATEGVTEAAGQGIQLGLAPELAPKTLEEAAYNVGIAAATGGLAGGAVSVPATAVERSNLTRAQRVEQQRLAELAAQDETGKVAEGAAVVAQAEAAVTSPEVTPEVAPEVTPEVTAPPRQTIPLPDLMQRLGERVQELTALSSDGYLSRSQMKELEREEVELRSVLREQEQQERTGALPTDPSRVLTPEEKTIATNRLQEITLQKEKGRAAKGYATELKNIQERLGKIDNDSDLTSYATELLGLQGTRVEPVRTQEPAVSVSEPSAPQPTTTVQPQPQMPPVEAPRPVSEATMAPAPRQAAEPTTQPPAAPIVREDVIDLETGRVTGEQTAEVGVPVNDTQRRQLEDFFNNVKANRSVNLPSDQQAAFARIMNVQVPPEQRKATPLRQALSRARTAWDALAGVKAVVRMGADPKIERYDRLIDSLATEDMKNVGFTLLQPETEARTPFQRALKDDPKELQTKGVHEVDPATGRDEVTIVGDGYARRDGTATVETTLHEIVHAKGAAAIRAVQEGRETDPAIVRAVNNLNDARLKLREAIPKKGLTPDEKSAVEYATTDVNEFHANTMTNPLVQSALKKESLWEPVKNAIRILLGVPRSQKSLLDEVLDASYALTDAINKRDARTRTEAKAKGGRVLFHGTTPQNVKSILESGKFSPEKGSRIYDYSEFGEDTIYLGTKESPWISNVSENSGDTGWNGRTATYPDQVGAIIDPSANIVFIEDGADVEFLEAKIDYEGEVGTLLKSLFVDGLSDKADAERLLKLPPNSPERYGQTDSDLRERIREIDKANLKSKVLIERLVKAGIDGIEIAPEGRLDGGSFKSSAPTPDQVAIFNPSVVKPVAKEEADNLLSLRSKSGSNGAESVLRSATSTDIGIRRSVTAPQPNTRSQRAQAGLPEARQAKAQPLRGTVNFTTVQGWRNGLGVSKDLFGDLFTGLMTSTRGVGTEVKVAERLRDGAKQETDLIVEAFLNRVRSVIDKTNPSEGSRKSINDRVMNYLRGNKAALDEVSGEVREVRAILGNKEFREAIDSARSEIDNLTKRIGQEIVRAYQGRPMPEAMTKKLQTLKNGLGVYMTRVYEAFIDRKYGADLLQKYEAGDETARDVLKPLLDRLTDQTAFLGENLDNAERVAKLENDALEAQGRKPTQKPWSSANWEKVSDIKLETMYRDLIGSASGLPREQMFNELRQWFNENVGKAENKKEASQKTAMRIVRDILLTNSTNTPMAQFWRKMRTDDRALKDLEDVPTDVRKALGEVKDPFLRAAFTMSRQTAVVASLAQNNTLMEYSPQLFKPQAERAQGVHDFRIPNNPLAYGKLAGMFTDKNTHDFIVGSTEIYGADSLTELADLATKFRSGEDYIGAVGAYVLRKGMALSQMQKFVGIVFNHGAAVLDFAGIPSFIIGRGNVDPSTLKSAVSVAKQLVGTQFRKNYSDETRRIMSLGIIDPALTRVDEQVDQAMRETELRQKLRKGTATYDVLKGFLTSTFNLIRDARAFAENIPKVANYLNNERFLRKAFPDLSQKEIERLAVEKTLRTEINYSMVPKMVRLTESIGVGYVVSFMWESYRTGFTNHIEAVREIRSGNPTMRQLGIQRLIGSTAGLAGMSYLYGTVLSGMVGALELDDEWDELMRYLGWHQQGQNRGILGISDDLTVTSADFGRMDGMDVYSATWRSVAQMLGQFAEGDDEGAIETAKATAEATASAFVGGAPLGTLAINTVAGRESKSFFEKEFPGLYDNFKASAGEVFGDSAATNIVDFLAAVTAAYTPGSFKQGLRGLGAAEREEGTPTVLALAAGMPVTKDNPLATLEGFPARAFINTRREASASIQDAVTIGTSKETPALMQSAVEDYISAQRDAYEELTKYANVARAAGRMVGKSEAELTKLIYESLKKNNGFPDEQADRLSKGLPFQPTMPRNQTTFLKSAIDRALGNQRQTTEVSRAAFAERRQQMEARKEQVLSLLEDRIKSYKPEQQ